MIKFIDSEGYYGLSEKDIPDIVSVEDATICYDELLKIYSQYKNEHNCFYDMLKKFKKDEFYKCHFIAIIYWKWLEQMNLVD